MAKYNSILSDDKIQKVFDKLQPLNADFISFGDFLFGSCIVSFKQKTGDIYKSGCILVNEKGDIVPIKFSLAKDGKYDGLECSRTETEGSSLLQLNRITDLNGEPTKYVHYGIEIHKERYGKPCWDWAEGIFDTESQWELTLPKGILFGIQAKIWEEDIMCISCLVNEKRKYGLIKKNWNGWKWLIKANFAYIDYKEEGIFTFDTDDLLAGHGCLYERLLEPYEVTENNGKKKVNGTVIKSSDDLIRKGDYAGRLFSDINSHEYEHDLKTCLFVTDDALTKSTDYFRAIRDSDIIEKELIISKKDQLIDFCISEYIDNKGNILNVKSLISGHSFEEAFLNHFIYINTLIQKQKIKVKEHVYNSMLSQEYAIADSEIRERLIAAKDCIYNILSQSQVTDLLDIIGTDSIDKLEIKLYGNVFIIHYSVDEFGAVENPSDYETKPRYLVVNKDGGIFCEDSTMVRYISDDVILYERGYLKYIRNEQEKRSLNYVKYYWVVEEQGIINYKGEMIYKGDLGDLNLASIESQYLLLEKPKFTPIERDKIEYYLSEFVSEKTDSCECPECGAQAYWDEDEECYICEDCENHVQREHKDKQSWELSETQSLAADNFEDVLSSEKVNHGQFITETEEERNEREYWEQDPEWQEEIRAMQEEREFWSDDEQEENYLEGKLYSLFSISKKSFLIPFQKCKILVNPHGFNPGIYLVDEQKEEGLTAGISMPFDPKLKKGEWVLQRSYWNGEYYHTLRGTVFHTIFDTFRYGPLTGMTLSLAFKKDFQTLVKYLQNGCVFITTNALKQLCQKYLNEHSKDIEKIILLRDLSFEFEGIKEGNDIIDGKASYYGIVEFGRDRFYDPIQDKGWHNGESFKDVVNNNPDYIIGLIKNDKIDVSNKILSDYTYNKTIYNRLKNAFEVQEKKRMEEGNRWPDYEPDYNDYERDTWNAMTDGQYGEMPEGFDGDYDFTGH